MRRCTIGICIPCHAPHSKYLQVCLSSIENQIRKPDLVSISISEMTVPPQLPTYSFPVKIVCSPEKQCQGKNRNIAANNAQAMDILTFFDADDIMHPMRIESIEKHFHDSTIDGFIHNNKQCASKQYRTKPLNHIVWEPVSNKLYTDGFITSKDYICGRITSSYGNLTNGHFTCRTHVWKDLQYPETYGIGEDSEYIYRIHSKDYKLGYSPDKLSYYLRDDFPEESYLFPGFTEYTSKIHPNVYCNYPNTEILNLIDYLVSENSPKRNHPIFIIESIKHLHPENKFPIILYNIEQMTRDTMRISTVERISLPDIIEVWDYSLTNTSILKNYGLNVKHVPIKLSLDTIIKYRNYRVQPEYDIVFCGQLSEYRKNILTKLEEKGKTVKIIDGEYSGQRDIDIGKAKLLINIHYNENYRVFESIRCEPWIASGMKVLSENSLDNSSRCITVPYDQLVEKACEILLALK